MLKKSQIHMTPQELQAEDSIKLLQEIRDKDPFAGVSAVTLKGDKGDPPSKEELIELITPLIPPPVHGKDGETPNVDKIANLVQSRINIDKITEKLSKIVKVNDGKDGKDGNDGKDGSPDTPDEVIGKVNKSKKKIDAERVRGLVEAINQIDQYGSNPMGKEAGGGGNVVRFLSNGVEISAYVTEINFSTNITPTYAGSGRITLTASGGSSTTYSETPSGDIDGSNTTYTVANSITTVINFAINGQYIHPQQYTTSGTTITMLSPLDASLSGTPFTIVYQ